MKHIIYSIQALVLLLFTACNSEGFKTAENGLEYRIFTKTAGDKPKIGDVVSMELYIATTYDSVIWDAPFTVQLTKPTHSGGSIENAIAMLAVGDSAEFKISSKGFFNNTRLQSMPFTEEKSPKLNFRIKTIHIKTQAKFIDEQKRLATLRYDEELRKLQLYIQKKTISVAPSMSGLYTIPVKRGKGKPATSGTSVTVHYTGAFLDGTVFDSSVARNETFTFEIGMQKVIAAWEEGVSQMHEGEKAQFIVPSHLAYGEKGYEGIIPPFSTLIFEIELISVNND